MTKQVQQELARWTFLVSLFSYALFWLVDLLRPGFVTRTISVHIFLLCLLLSGGIWAYLRPKSPGRFAWVSLGSLCVGICFAMVFYTLASEVLLAERLVFSVLIGAVPWLCMHLIRHS